MGRASTKKTVTREIRSAVDKKLTQVCRMHMHNLCRLPLRARIRVALMIIFKGYMKMFEPNGEKKGTGKCVKVSQ